ncbi:MFS transporter [Trinickia dinghuensis]|uniref:MFS transporter n=2 Tax=Trinickia dinghuensis TaxID=2291023 RepID=A0A3D8JXT5_9BURK|nr:MFS transporter [Trinickia dinghuensis]
MEDLPLQRFHLRVVLAGSGGQFNDGFILGIVGIALSVAATPLHLDATWIGLIGAASLAGLFLGSFFVGPLADRFGRRSIFAYDMIIFALLSAGQYFVTSPLQLLIFRVLLGLVLGADYAVAKSLVIEYLPRRSRGRLVSFLAVAWGIGYVAAYFVGYAIKEIDPHSWRMMLAISGVPALLIIPARLSIPESPLWLIKKDRVSDALRIVQRTFGSHVTLDMRRSDGTGKRSANWSALFTRKMRRNTLVGCVFFTCQVIPYFALGTFSPRVLQALHVENSLVGAMVYNALLILGLFMGLALIDRVPRRSFLIWTFYGGAVLLALLASTSISPMVTIVLFGLFACVLSGSTNAEPLYTAELFPTELRATGTGFVIACSRLGSAIATFLLPLAVQRFGIETSLLVCVGTLVFGGVFCHVFAPETRDVKLGELGSSIGPGEERLSPSARMAGSIDRADRTLR